MARPTDSVRDRRRRPGRRQDGRDAAREGLRRPRHPRRRTRTQPPYERPPLSKGFLLGTAAFDRRSSARGLVRRARRRPADRPHRARPRPGHAQRRPVRRRGISYDRLLLATGARPRVLDVPGAERVRTLRTVEDSRRPARRLRPRAHASSSAAAGSASRPRPPRARPATTSRSRSRADSRCSARWAPRWRGTSPSCTGARRRPASSARCRRDQRRSGPSRPSSPTATELDADLVRHRASARHPTPSSPRRPV